MRRGILTAVGAAVLLVAAGLAGAVGPAATNAQQANSDGRTIDVAASGQAQADPDQAVLRIAVVATADDADTVRERLAENVSQMQAALAAAGVPDDQIRTVAFNIAQRYDPETDEPRGFEGVHAFEVTLSNVWRAGAVIDAAVGHGADRVDSVELTLSEDRRRGVQADALRDAMADARSNADVLAESAELEITGVHSVSTGDVRFQPVRTEALEADAGGETTTTIDSGPVTVSAQVQVTYDATDA